MPPATTQAAARAQLQRHFAETLRALPAGLALVQWHPELPKAGLPRGVTLPWDESDPDDVLEFFDLGYWVLGTTPDTSDRYFDLILEVWRELGWPTRTDRDARPRTGYGSTPDGYGLTVTQSINGYLSLAGSTPPFPAGSDEGDPPPLRIDRPGTTDSGD
ncbi:hypothetical protein ACIP5Y_43220 [Nocardia sp. NPDC088792]|uniref:hypothetical protein n=1 Tax=Nocardia sp. NPDC088792 TaxID=3364332 RepID=UPI0038055D2B